MENSIRKRLSLQKEVLSWLDEFFEKLHKRANDVTFEVHELLKKTDNVEQDMKNTLNSFRTLSSHQFVENKVSEEDEISSYKKEDAAIPAEVELPAQSYEGDILPRYKEALSLGLRSYQNHIQKTNRSSSSGSVFKSGLGCGSLPHIIGSEEYIHDNSCGLSEDLMLERLAFDFRRVAEPKGVSIDAANFGSNTLFSEDEFGSQEEPSQKQGTEPLVSAASDFKAMLEAALLSSYKFYDEETSTSSDIVHGYSNPTETRRSDLDHVTTSALDTVDNVASQHLSGRSNPIESATPGSPSSFQIPDTQTPESCSALISGSLFDTEENSPPSFIHEFHEIFSTKNGISRDTNGNTLVNIDEKDYVHDSLFEDDDSEEKEIVPQCSDVPQEISSISLSSTDGGNVLEATELTFASDKLVNKFPEEANSSFVYPSNFGDEDGLERSSQLSDDPQRCLDTNSFGSKVSSGPSMVEASPSLPAKFDDSSGDEDENVLTQSGNFTSKELKL